MQNIVDEYFEKIIERRVFLLMSVALTFSVVPSSVGQVDTLNKHRKMT